MDLLPNVSTGGDKSGPLRSQNKQALPLRIPTDVLPRQHRNARASIQHGSRRMACLSALLFSADAALLRHHLFTRHSIGAQVFTWARPWAPKQRRLQRE